MNPRHAVVVSVLLLGTAWPSGAVAAQASAAGLRQRDCAVVARLTGLEGSIGGIFEFMMDYQKVLNKEAREETKGARLTKELVGQQKAAKLATDQKQIDRQMAESDEKARAAMSAATTSLVVGIASGLAQLGGIGPTGSQPNDRGFQDFVLKTDALQRDLANLNAEIRRSDASANTGKGKRLPIAEIERMKAQLGNSLLQVRNAKKLARPC